ncbi:MAG: hypothetical protein E7319_11060 [Clostridiales bacterium]|nr:hypothetical protein [Clostridiales bacterium]
MKGNKPRRIITLEAVFVYLALFCISTYALLEHVSLSIPMFSQVKMPLLIMGGVCLVTKFGLFANNLLRRKYFFVFLTVCALCVILAWSMYVNRNPEIGVSPIRNTVRLILFLLEMFFLAMVIAETGRGKATLNFLFWYLLVLLIINDIALFTRVITFRIGKFEGFIVGNKFAVSYLHLDLLALWVARSRKTQKKRKYPFWLVLLIAVYMIAVAIRVDCMTGVLGSVAMVGLLVLADMASKQRRPWLTSHVTLLLALFVSVLFAFVVNLIVSIPVVSRLIEDVLGRDATLTGRTNIYAVYISKLDGHWSAGYGFGNGNEVADTLFGYPNAQNALLQWVLQVGIYATGMLVFLMQQVFRHLHRKAERHTMEMVALVVLIYIYVMLGTVEISFNMTVIMWLMLAYALVNERPRKQAVQPVKPMPKKRGRRVALRLRQAQ